MAIIFITDPPGERLKYTRLINTSSITWRVELPYLNPSIPCTQGRRIKLQLPPPEFKTNTSTIMSQSRIAQLASAVAHHTQRVDSYLAEKNLPQPSFDADSPVHLGLPADIEQSRVAALQASQELNELLQGPRDLLFNFGVGCHVRIPTNFPPRTNEYSTTRSYTCN